MPKDQVPEQVRKAQNKVQDTYEDSRGRNYDIRQVVKGNERLVTATGMIRDAMLKTCEIKDRDTLRKHIEAQEMLFHLITLYAWAVLKNRYKKKRLMRAALKLFHIFIENIDYVLNVCIPALCLGGDGYVEMTVHALSV